MSELIQFFDDGDELTCVPSVNVLGKHYVKISGDINADGLIQIAPAGAGDRPFGVACWDAVVGQRVTVYRIESHLVVPIVQSGALAANDPVKVGAAGVAIKALAGDNANGICCTSSADGADAMIALGRFQA